MSCASSSPTSGWWSPRSSRAAPPPATTPKPSNFTLRCPSQSVAAMRGQLAGSLNVKPEELRVLTDDVGGAFGMKGAAHPEYVALLHAARALRRPVHWLSTRSEAFLSDAQGRDSFWTVELALSARGRFQALRVNCLGNMGAYITPVAHFIVTTHISGCLPTVYDIPHAQVNTRCVFTNTVPTAPYRGAGRPEAGYLIERVVDAAADQLGIDAAELRRRNLIEPEQMPYTTAFGNTYDSGEFPALLERALALADYAGFPARKKAAEKGAQAAWARHRLLSGDRRRLPGRGRAYRVSRRQQGHCQRRRRRQRAGPSDRVPEGGRAPARHRPGGGDAAFRRLSARRARLRRGRLALGDVCRRRRRAHGRRRDREGQARRRHAVAGERSRRRLRRRQVQREEPRGLAVRSGRARRRAQAARRHPREPRHHREDQSAALVPQWLSRRRGRDRRRHRRARGRQLRRGRRLRQRARRYDRDRSDSWRRGARARPGAHRANDLRRARPAGLRLVHGLRACRAPTACRQ